LAADPLGPPAPPSVGKPYCGSVQGGWADLPLSTSSIIEIATEPFDLTAGCIDLPLPARSSFLCFGVLRDISLMKMATEFNTSSKHHHHTYLQT
jgi:hypothetical protein